MEQLSQDLPGIEILSDRTRMEPYMRDEALRSTFYPRAVLFPRSTAEVSKILRFASGASLPVIPRGAGSGLSGGAVALEEAIILSTERMDKILEVDLHNRVIVAQPGVITGEIRKTAEAHSLFYPPIPASVDFCSIGGNVATNAGGLCAVKYGVTREYVMALEAVLPSGEVIRTGGRFLKNSTAYNLTQLLIGSEGTLAVITEITLKLLPAPKYRVLLLVPFDSLDKATEAVVHILGEGITPPTLEFLPKEAIQCVLSLHSELSFPFVTAEASLILELDAFSESNLNHELSRLEEALDRLKTAPPVVAQSPAQRDEIWSVRKLCRDSIAKSGPFEEADSVVPKSKVPDLVRAAYSVGRRHHLQVISYGHAGDGNLHTYFQPRSQSQTDWSKISQEALYEFFEATVKLGGTISGEHGIGSMKRNYLPLVFSKEELELMRRIKRAFDPQNILNPGKVLP